MAVLSDLFCDAFGAAETLGHDPVRKISVGTLSGEAGSCTSVDGRNGSYISIMCGSVLDADFEADDASEAVSEALLRLSSISSRKGTILIAALGNSAVAADSLGVRTAERIIPLRTEDGGGVCVIRTGVSSATGIASAEYIKAMASHVGADLIICIDALAAHRPERIGSVIQVTDAGIAPGSGAASHTAPLSHGALGIPVVTLGIPTVLRTASSDGSVTLYTLALTERLIDVGAAVLAGGINRYLFRLLRQI